MAIFYFLVNLVIFQIPTSVSKRLKELRMEEESVCFLPEDVSGSLYYRTVNGTIQKYGSLDEVTELFSSGKSVIIAVTRNLWCEVKLCERKFKSYGPLL